MSLYYEDEFVQLHHGDCRAIRGWTRADVLVTDPPYGIGWKQAPLLTVGRSEGQRSRAHDGIQNDGDTSARDAALELFGSGPALVFGEITKPFPPRTKRVLVWKKPNDSGLMGQTIWRKGLGADLHGWPLATDPRHRIIRLHFPRDYPRVRRGRSSARKAGGPDGVAD